MLFHCEAAFIYVCVLIRGVMHNIIVYLIPNLRQSPWDSRRGGLAQRNVGGCLGIPQGDLHEILTRHKQDNFSYRIGKMANVKFPDLKIGPDIDLVYPNSSIFTNIVMTSNWMRAVSWSCSIQSGRAKLLSARFCACRLFKHPALFKINR